MYESKKFLYSMLPNSWCKVGTSKWWLTQWIFLTHWVKM